MDKKTLCYSCLGCDLLENKGFKGTDKCNNYRPDNQSTFIDRICKEWENKKLEKKKN